MISSIAKHYQTNKNTEKKIVLGHTKTDNVETYLLQRSRKIIPEYYGIKYSCKLKNEIIKRPLLNISRRYIIKKLEENSIKFITDASNEQIYFLRNRIRASLLNFPEELEDIIVQLIKIENKLLKFKKKVVQAIIT